MNDVYLQLTSAYRDRVRYPYPADFCVGMSPEVSLVDKQIYTGPFQVSSLFSNYKQQAMYSSISPPKTNYSLLDPITNAFPVYIFNVQSIGNNCVGPTIFKNGSTYTTPILGVIPITPFCEGYSDISGWYQSYYIHNNTLNDYKLITEYNPSDRSVTLQLPFPFTFNEGDNYNLIDLSYFNQPSSIYFTPFESNKLNLQYFDLFRRENPFIDNYYVGNYVYNYNTKEIVSITDYNSLTHTVSTNKLFNFGVSTNSIGPLGNQVGDLLAIRTTLPIYTQIGRVFDLIAPNKVQLSSTASSTKNDYVGQFFFMTPLFIDSVLQGPYNFSGPSTTTTTTNYKISKYLFKIIEYDEINKILILENSFDTFDYSISDFNSRWFEILPFSRNNYSPLNYSGSMVSVTNAVCYEIELISLILPNRELASGGLPAFLNYVYVELNNVTSSESNAPNTIYSNNPSSNKAVFICPIRNIRNPLISSFVKVNSSGMKQTIKFKPNDNLHLRVYLPNGELFVTKMEENPLYTNVNQLIQISATFSIKRL